MKVVDQRGIELIVVEESEELVRVIYPGNFVEINKPEFNFQAENAWESIGASKERSEEMFETFINGLGLEFDISEMISFLIDKIICGEIKIHEALLIVAIVNDFWSI